MDNSDVTLERMRTFVRVAERGSLSAVAREFGVGQSTVTRHLRELEEAVGVPLLSRTTRRVTLTDEGSRYYANGVQILRLVEQAGDEARGKRGTPAGMIRISCTAAFGVLHVSRRIFAFQDRYPDIGVDLSLIDERVDLVREGVDIALRLEGPNGERHVVPFGGRFRVDHGLAAREALIAGRGIAPAHRWLVDDLLAAGRLEAILPDYSLPSTPLSMLIVPERAGIARVRLLVDFLVEQAGGIPGIERVQPEQ